MCIILANESATVSISSSINVSIRAGMSPLGVSALALASASVSDISTIIRTIIRPSSDIDINIGIRHRHLQQRKHHHQHQQRRQNAINFSTDKRICIITASASTSVGSISPRSSIRVRKYCLKHQHHHHRVHYPCDHCHCHG